jgi:4-amino-4-deoxy-L-arabinose transferase-like glycosyltransferase
VLAILVIAAVAGPWFATVGVRTEGRWLRSFFIEHNAERFLKPNMGHSGPMFYHVLSVLVGFFPWSVFLPQAIVHLIRRVRQRDTWSRSDVFVACWAGAYLVFFSLARTKLPNYVLPAYPALALVTGAFLDAWLRKPAVANFAWLRAAWMTSAVCGALMAVALAVGALWVLPGASAIGLAGLVPLVGGIFATIDYDRRRNASALVTFSVAATYLMFVVFAAVAPIVGQYNSAPRIAACWRADAADNAPLATFRHLDPSEAYYAGRMVRYCVTPHDVTQFFAESSEACILARSSDYAAIAPSLPEGVCVLDRRRRFLKDGELLLIGRADATAVASQGNHDAATRR